MVPHCAPAKAFFLGLYGAFACVCLIREAPDIKLDSGTISLGDLARRDALRLQFKAWKAAFDSLLLTESHAAAEFDPSKVLLMYHLLNGIWLETGVSPRETETDRFLSEFDTIVSLAEAIQAFVNSPEQRAHGL